MELESSGAYKEQQPKKPWGGEASRQRIKVFGPVSTPVGGKGAGVIPRKCNKFHASPQEACTAGVPTNEGFPAELCGLCAYEH